MILLFKLLEGDPPPAIGADAFMHDHQTASVRGEWRVGAFAPTAPAPWASGLVAVNIPMADLDLVTDEAAGTTSFRLIAGDLDVGFKTSEPEWSQWARRVCPVLR